MLIYYDMLMWSALISMENKSSRREQLPFLTTAKQRKESYFVLMLLLVGWISLPLTGLCSLILQMNPRVGRTARGEGGKGNALLFLIPEELRFLKYLKDAKVPVKEYEFNENKLKNVQSQLEKLVANNYHLNRAAKDAYRSYLLAYNSHSMKDIFNVHRLDLQAVAASFCFSNPPKVNLNLDSSASKFRKSTRKEDGKRHGINRFNPYGKPNRGDDTRQFVRH